MAGYDFHPTPIAGPTLIGAPVKADQVLSRLPPGFDQGADCDLHPMPIGSSAGIMYSV
jgi:hypothetical protein